jgi:hypothetical protein
MSEFPKDNDIWSHEKVLIPIAKSVRVRFMLQSRGHDLNEWGVSVMFDIQD